MMISMSRCSVLLKVLKFYLLLLCVCIWCVCVCVCVHVCATCYRAHVKITGQLCGLASLVLLLHEVLGIELRSQVLQKMVIFIYWTSSQPLFLKILFFFLRDWLFPWQQILSVISPVVTVWLCFLWENVCQIPTCE